VKNYFARTTRLVESQIESLTLIKRKHIVEERILIWKLHCRADRNRKHVRMEFLVLLHHAVSGELTRTLFFRLAKKQQPDHHVAFVRLRAANVRDANAGINGRGWRKGGSTPTNQKSQQHWQDSWYRSPQKLTPA